ncbi:MAG: CsbD family protein [Actinomycetota bacterium]|nr:CsbD family protein [Actinomycetota bacterium]
MDTAKSIQGHVKEVLGAVTGDRRVEAEGQVEQQVADPQGQESVESEESVSHHEREVREAHHDIVGTESEDATPLGT